MEVADIISWWGKLLLFIVATQKSQNTASAIKMFQFEFPFKYS